MKRVLLLTAAAIAVSASVRPWIAKGIEATMMFSRPGVTGARRFLNCGSDSIMRTKTTATRKRPTDTPTVKRRVPNNSEIDASEKSRMK